MIPDPNKESDFINLIKNQNPHTLFYSFYFMEVNKGKVGIDAFIDTPMYYYGDVSQSLSKVFFAICSTDSGLQNLIDINDIKYPSFSKYQNLLFSSSLQDSIREQDFNEYTQKSQEVISSGLLDKWKVINPCIFVKTTKQAIKESNRYNVVLFFSENSTASNLFHISLFLGKDAKICIKDNYTNKWITYVPSVKIFRLSQYNNYYSISDFYKKIEQKIIKINKLVEKTSKYREKRMKFRYANNQRDKKKLIKLANKISKMGRKIYDLENDIRLDIFALRSDMATFVDLNESFSCPLLTTDIDLKRDDYTEKYYIDYGNILVKYILEGKKDTNITIYYFKRKTDNNFCKRVFSSER